MTTEPDFAGIASCKPISITASDTVRISGLLQNPRQARACYVLARGAGTGEDYPFMTAVATELARRGIASLRFQFPYMERGAKRPDPPQLAQATVRAQLAQRQLCSPNIRSLPAANRLAAG